jgi:ATP-dependent Clp protease protease subunit
MTNKLKGLVLVTLMVAGALLATTYTVGTTNNETATGASASDAATGNTTSYITLPGFSYGNTGDSNSENTTRDFNAPSTDLKEKSESPVNSNKSKQIQQMNLNNGRIVYLLGEVGMNAMAAADEITRLSNKSSKPIYLILSGPGGSVLSGSAVISAIQSSKAPVYTVCLLICASMDAMIHQYGERRFVTDRTVLMFHQASSGSSGEVAKMLSYTKFLSRYVSKIEFEVSKRWGVSLEAYQQRTFNELWIDAEDSVSQNIADGIVSINIPEAVINKDAEASKDKKDKNKVKNFDIKWIMNYER